MLEEKEMHARTFIFVASYGQNRYTLGRGVGEKEPGGGNDIVVIILSGMSWWSEVDKPRKTRGG